MATLAIRIDPGQAESGARVVKRSLDDVKRAANDVEKSTQRAANSVSGIKRGADGVRVVQRSFDDVKRSADNATKSVGVMGRGFDLLRTKVVAFGAAIGAAFGIRALTQMADTWSDMSARVGLAIRDMDAAGAAMARISDVADRTYSSIGLTAEGFARNSTVLRELGKTTQQQLDYMEALNSALVASGARGRNAEFVQESLNRSMALGAMRGIELNNVLNYGGVIAEALAEHFNTTTGGLMKLAQEGKITADVIYNVLSSRLDEFGEKADAMPATIEDGFLRIGNALTRLVGSFDHLTGASAGITVILEGIRSGIHGLRTGMEALAANLDQVAEAAGIVGVALSLVFGRTALSVLAMSFGWFVGGVLAGLTAIKAAVMANPLGALATGLMIAVTAAYYFRDEIQKAIGVDVVEIAKTAANFVINSFSAAYADIVFVWSNFGNIMGAAVVGGVNVAIKAMNSLVASAKIILNDLIDHINRIPFVNVDRLDPTNDPIREMRNPYASRLSAANDAHRANVQEIMSRDVIGDWASGFKASEQAAIDLDKAIQGVASSTEEADKAAKKAAEAYKRIVDGAQDFVRAQQLEANLIGLPEQAANALRYEFDLLNEARRAGIELTDADRWGFKALAEAMAEAEERTRHLTEAFDFTKSTIKGFFSDLRSGLEEGKSFWEAFADAGTKALQKIADKLIEMALDQMINNVLRNLMGAFNFGGGLGGGFGNTSYFPPAPSGGFHTLAGGGFVSGPGTSTSDSIPAWLSDGEFVVRAASVAQPGVLPLLEAINSGDFAARMAMGGLARIHGPANINAPRFSHGGLARTQPVSHGNAALNLRVDVQNNSSAQVEVGEPRQEGGELVLPMIIRQVEDAVAGSIANNGKVGRAVQQSFGLKRVTR